MRRTTFGYFWGRSFKNTRTNRPMTVVSVSVLAICLVLLGTFILVSMNISNYLKKLGEANVIRVYPAYDATQQEVDDLYKRLGEINNVAEIKYVPKDQGLEEFKETYKDYSEIMDGFAENPLPDKFIISLNDLTLTDNTVVAIKQTEGVDQVTWSASATKSIVTLQRVFMISGMVIVAILAVVSMFIISNTIRASLHYRHLEIMIMRLVGAKNSFISKPFIFEGMIIGFMGSALAYLVEYLIYRFGLIRLVESIELLTPIPFEQVALPLAAAFLGVGLITSALGSSISIRKHLKV